MKKNGQNGKIHGSKKQHCVRSSCDTVGVGPEEKKRMIQLLGARASRHEIETNIKGRPPKFR